MKAVLQRVSEAEVWVDGENIASIGAGLLVLLGVAKGDGEPELDWLLGKIAALRIFEDDEGKMNRSIQDIDGEILLVSQFTLLADARKGRRPSFDLAAPPAEAEVMYELAVERLKEKGLPVQTGRFGADMKVGLVNDGPVTILLDTAER